MGNDLRKTNKIDSMQAFLLILPQVIGFLVFTLYPIIWVLKYVWFDFDGVAEQFVGLANIIRVFSADSGYWASLVNTLIVSFGKLIIELPLALILAVMLSSNLKGKTFFRMIFYLPNVISVAIIGVVFSFMFASFDGIVNSVLQNLNLIQEPINWFGNKWTAMLVIAFASIWQGFGINMLFFLSGLMSIPADLYEAADVEGATTMQQFFHITLPMLAPVLKIITMLAIVGSIKIMDLVLVLTNGQPAGQTEVAMTYIFKQFFTYSSGASTIPQIGYACALGFVTSIAIGILTYFYMKLTKKMDNIE